MAPAPTSLPDVPGLRELGPAFHAAFAAMAGRLAIDADAIAALISHESRFRPDARNPLGGASGLMQWMPATARHLGTTVEAIRASSALEQLALVERTFKPWAGKLAARDVPIVGFGPAFIGRPDDHVAYRAGEKGYDWNTALDLDRNGELTVGEVRRHVLRLLDSAATRPRIPVDASAVPTPSPPSRASGGLWLALVALVAPLVAWGRR